MDIMKHSGYFAWILLIIAGNVKYLLNNLFSIYVSISRIAPWNYCVFIRVLKL